MIAHNKKLRAVTLHQCEATIKTMLEGNRRTNVAFVLEIGRELDAAHKQLSRHGDGAFNGWCRDKLNLKRTTAWKYLTVYYVFGDCSLCKQSYDLSALYLLARPSTRGAIRKLARKFAEQGGIVEAWRVKHWLRMEHEERPARKRVDEDDLDPPESGKNEKREATFETLVRVWKRAPREERRKFTKWVNDRIVTKAGKRNASNKT
jgi:hypothetical protein